jgi:CPA1 family monovalent cation:H+ antiporter
VLVLTTAVVVATLVTQGLSLAPLVNRSGIALEPEHTAREEARTRRRLAGVGLEHLDQLADLDAAPTAALEQARRALDARLQHDQQEPGEQGQGAGSVLAAYRQIRREVIALQGGELRRLYEDHEISDTTRRHLQFDLDREESALAEGP